MYRGRIEKDFNIWVSKGMLGADAAKAMLAEYPRDGFQCG
jgi:hypothetical protein